MNRRTVLLALLSLLVFTFTAGCAVDPVAKGYADRIKAHDDALYQQAEYFVGLADRRNYASPTTRPYADPQVIARHRQSIQEGRDLQDEFQKYANAPKP
jgi:hypothetical protein